MQATVKRSTKKRARAPERLYDYEDDALKRFGRRWLPMLLVGWGLLQVADVVLTYWGLSLPTIFEANPVMAGVITTPWRVILIKASLTTMVSVLLLRIEYRTPFSSIPIFVFLNILMAYVFFNNWGLISRAGAVIVHRAVAGG